MNNRIKQLLFCMIVLSGFMISSCSKNRPIGAYYTYEIECMGNNMDGSESVLVWGSGKNKSEAIAQAKKNAIDAVLFTGIRRGKSGCVLNPLVPTVNAKEKYAEYFASFYANKVYENFISADSKRGSRMKEENKQENKYGIVIAIDYLRLKEQLINDNIIQK